MATNFRSVRPTTSEFAPYYASYIDRVPDGDIIQTLAKQRIDTMKLFASLTPEQAAFRYATGKWSVREVIGHVVDAERIFAYRALRVGRNDKTPLAGFEENDYVKFASFESRSVAGLAGDFDHVRTATIDLFGSFTEEAWMRAGTANAFDVSVRALAWIIAGHERHHVEILKSRYLGR